MIVSITECPPLLTTHKIFTRIALVLFVFIFAGDDEAIEDLPPEGLKLLDPTSHVFVPIQAADNGVDFELDTKLLAPTRDFR